MKPEQKIVAIGAASGVLGMLVLVALFTHLIGAPDVANEIGARLAYALLANVVAVIPLFLMFITIGNERFLSEAIDPLRHAENRTMEINGRVSQNTLEQNFVFLIASLALAILIPITHLQVVWACAFTFVIGRFLFWVGYHKNPLYRAPGLSSVAYMNLFIILFVLVQLMSL
ncbi:MAG: MAPEG family protein [Minisyncoccia bacterium]